MNGESSPIPPKTVTAEEQLKAQRWLLHSLCIAVLILTGTFFVYLYRQVVSIRKSTKEMVRFMEQYEKSDTAAAIDRVQRELNEYRKTNPDFDPIYVRYFGTNSLMPTLSTKVSTNAP